MYPRVRAAMHYMLYWSVVMWGVEVLTKECRWGEGWCVFLMVRLRQAGRMYALGFLGWWWGSGEVKVVCGLGVGVGRVEVL